MTTFNLAPLYRSTVGYDRLFDMLGNSIRPDWPPYDIVKKGENEYRITMVVAGFSPEEIELTQNGTSLLIAGQKTAEESPQNMLHQGITSRNFKQTFSLAAHVTEMRQQANVVEESALAEILHDPEMTKGEKRAILASWISDARAVPDAPAWRQIGGGKILHIDKILEALKLLDDVESPVLACKPKRPTPLSFNRRRRNSRRHQEFTKWFWRNDNDPPPAPTPAAQLSFA